MKFLFPTFLYALFAIAIPIIIHLFNFRKYKKMYFPNVKFIQEIQQQTQSKSKLKHLLVLAARILAIVFLVLAFAQPYIPDSEEKIDTQEKAISIYIDNSFSMEGITDNGTLINEAKRKALEIIEAYKPNDQFQLLTNDFEGRHQRLISKEEFVNLLEEINISPEVRTIEEVLSRQNDILNHSSSKTKLSYLISDFQKSFIKENIIKEDSLIKHFLLPVSAIQNNNLYIDSIWYTSPVRQVNQPEELIIRIKNASDIDYENIPLKLFINNQQKSPSSFSITKHSNIEIPINYTSQEIGVHNCVIKLNDYPISYDDDFFFSYNVSKHINLLIINEEKESSYLNSLYQSDSVFVLNNTNQKNIDYSSLSNHQLIILNEIKNISTGLSQELIRFTKNGGSLVVFPDTAANLDSYLDFLLALNADYYTILDTNDTKTEKLNLNHQIFKNVFTKVPENIDFPLVKTHYRLSNKNLKHGENIVKLLNGEALLNEYKSGKGKIYLFSIPLNTRYSNFAKHALFVPVMYKIAILSEPTTYLYYTIGKDNLIELGKDYLSGEHVYHLQNTTAQFDIIPQHTIIDNNTILDMRNQIRLAGNYNLTAGKNFITPISFNYNRIESELYYFSEKELIDLFISNTNFKVISFSEKSLTETINQINLGIRLWKLCVIFVLLFLGFEVLLLRLWK